ncbi:MAG TPA: hypothetical protein ENI23_12200 [bacterium]|nr:hypothetical protein [bacterium]
MVWFDKYESLSKRNKWRKMATDSEKRIEAKRLVREQETKDKKKLEDDTRREALQTRLQWFRENERVPAKKEQTVTPTPSRRDPTSLVDYSQPPTSIMGGFPRDDPDYYSGGKFRAEQVEDNRREKEEETTRKRATFRNIDAELARRQAVKDFVTAADILDYSSADSAAYRMILAPNSTIPLSAFDDVPETRDFIIDVRGGNYDRISELQQPGSKIGSDLLNQHRFNYSSRLGEPEETPEGLSFAPKLSEIVDYDASDLGKFYKGDDVIVGDEARAFFIPDEAEREAALLSMPWEEQIQFSLQWIFELQEDKIIGGKFNELTPVPGLGKLYEDSLLLLADIAINERRILTEEERALAEFFSLAAGFPDISLTQEQKDTLAQILRDEEKIAVEAGTFEGESDYVNFLERLSKPSELGVEEIPMSEEALLIHSPMAQLEAQIREEQDFIRGNIPLSDFERMTKIHPVGIVIANMIRAFEEGYHHISKPLYEKYIGPTLATTGGATYGAIETGISLPAITGVPLAPDVRGTVSDTYRNAVTSETANVVGGELLNPMNVTFVVPFIGPGSRFMKAYQAGNRLLAVQILADEFMFTGRTPEIAGYFARQGTRGLAAVSKMGLRSTLKRWPELRGNNVFIRMMSGVKRAGKDVALPWLDQPARAQARRELLETISRTNLAAANKNKILRLLRARQAGMNVTYSLNEFDPSLIKQTILENNLLVEESLTGTVRAYPYIGTGLPGQEETVRLLREGTVDEIISRAEDTAIQIEKGFTPVERGINNEISRLGTVIDELSGNTAKMATKKGRLERTVVLRELTEVIAYRVGRGMDDLGDNLVLKTEQLYDEMDILVEGNNGLLSPTGRFYDLGDETPTQAARNIWDKTVEGIDDLPNEIGGTEGDILSGIITRFSDEVGIIGITRVGDNKLIIEATTDITKQQIDQIRRIIREENIKDIDFSFDTVHGIRANERQILYRGAPDEKFDDILNKTQRIKTSKIAERLRGLEDAVPIGEGVAVLPPGFKVLPDPDMVDALVRTFKTYNPGEIPPPGVGFILQDGRIVYLGDNMKGAHAFVLRLVADQTNSPSEAIQLVLLISQQF